MDLGNCRKFCAQVEQSLGHRRTCFAEQFSIRHAHRFDRLRACTTASHLNLVVASNARRRAFNDQVRRHIFLHDRKSAHKRPLAHCDEVMEAGIATDS